MSVLKRWNGSSWEKIGPAVEDTRYSNINNMIAAEYDSTITYSIGDLVVYNDKLYRCVNDIVNAEVWTPAHWSETSVKIEFEALSQHIVGTTSYKNTSSSDTTSRIFGAYFKEKTYLRSIKPVFSGTAGGTGTVEIYTVQDEVAVGANITLIESKTFTIGEPISFNQWVTPETLICIHGDDNAILRYSGPSATWTLDVGIARISSNKATIDQLPSGRFAGTFVLNVFNDSSDPLPYNMLMAIGDSMVYGHTLGPSKAWPALVAKNNNMQVDNRGTNGAYMSNVQYNNKDNSVYQKICVSESEFYISDTDLQAAKYILIYAGTNDCNHSITIGTTDSVDPATFCGALNLICQTLQTRAPTSKIAFITPYLRAGIESRCENYITAIKTVCRKYSIPVFDNGANGGICWTSSAIREALTLGGADTFHLNEEGMKYVASKYAAFLRNL